MKEHAWSFIESGRPWGGSASFCTRPGCDAKRVKDLRGSVVFYEQNGVPTGQSGQCTGAP